MVRNLWTSENRKITICVDDYNDGVIKGRFYHATQGMSQFQSMTQLLLKMDAVLEDIQEPQSYTSKRTFATVISSADCGEYPASFRNGAKATFELKVLFRQHSSWQGIAVWKDRMTEQSFRSVLELIVLLDSALQDTDREAVS